MQKRVVLGVVGLAVVATAIIALVRPRGEDERPASTTGRDTTSQLGSMVDLPSKTGLDPLVEEFRATERTLLHRYNTALRDQRANMIDELELSNTLERDVLEPWRALRAKVVAAPPQDELYRTLRLYLEARQLSWEAYVAALRAPSDEAARPHYASHREKNAEATDHAKELGRMFREAAARANQ